MKKRLEKIVLVILGIIVALATLCFIGISLLVFVLFPYQDRIEARRYVKEIKSITLPENTEIVDEYVASGHLLGTEDEECFGAVLIKSSLSDAELDMYYSAYRLGGREEDKAVTAEIQDTLEEFHIYYALPADYDDGNYYLIYTWRCTLS